MNCTWPDFVRLPDFVRNELPSAGPNPTANRTCIPQKIASIFSPSIKNTCCYKNDSTYTTHSNCEISLVLLSNTQNQVVDINVLSISPFLVFDDNTRICNEAHLMMAKGIHF